MDAGGIDFETQRWGTYLQPQGFHIVKQVATRPPFRKMCQGQRGGMMVQHAQEKPGSCGLSVPKMRFSICLEKHHHLDFRASGIQMVHIAPPSSSEGPYGRLLTQISSSVSSAWPSAICIAVSTVCANALL